MTPEFFALVSEMRKAQKKYFKTRMSYDLEHAKKLEKEVDEMIKKETTAPTGKEQRKLF